MFSEVRCPEVSVNNTDAVNMTEFYLQTVLVTCSDEHYAFGNENMTSYVTTCHANKTFEPLQPCESKDLGYEISYSIRTGTIAGLRRPSDELRL